ncbi:MAG: MaoC family dehydratase [Hyphomicrobiales bacterium]|nr:MaoC family dehydratase [Hyphomicrobiales bacterium]
MPEFYYEDFVPGSILEFGDARAITKDEIIRFAEVYDPQPFHLDEEAAKKSMLGALCASGWHIGCLAMRLNYDHWISRTASMGAPGIDEMRWERPLLPGDILSGRRKVVHKRVSRTRPEMGLVAIEFDLLNQRGETIARQKHTQLIELRHPGKTSGEEGAAPPPAPHPSHAIPRVEASGRQKPFAGWLEDLQVGSYLELGTETFTKDSIVGFASLYDPQRFHLDEEEAKNSLFGRLSASGWQTASLWMRNVVRTRDRVQRDLRAQGVETPQGGPSPGFVHLRWPKPVFVGDRVTYYTQIIEKRPTTRPGWGLVFNHNTGVNQNGELVYEFRGSGFIRTRAGGKG